MASTVSSSSGLISASGLASGIDTATLVTQLIQLDRAPATVIESNRTKQQTHLSAIKEMNTRLLALRDAIDPLKDSSTFATKTVSSSDSTVVTAKATSAASPGSLTFSVDELASASQVATASGAVPTGTGAVWMAIGGGDAFSIDVTTATLQGIASAVNAANKGVTASVINDGNGERLLFSSTKTGEANGIAMLYGDDGLASVLPGLDATDGGQPIMTEVSAAKNAKITVGSGLSITSSTNTFDAAIPGLTLTVKAKASAVSVTVAQDSDSVASSIQALVDGYNSAFSYYSANGKYDTATSTAGALFADYDLRSQLNAVNAALTKRIPGQADGYATLADVGVTVSSDGTMGIDATKLQDKLAANPDAVASLFKAVGASAYAPMDGLTRSTNGAMALKTSQLQTTIDNMTASIAKIDARLVERKAYYQAKFLAMEQTIARLQSQGNYLSSFVTNSSSSSSK